MDIEQILKDLGFNNIVLHWGVWSFKYDGKYNTIHSILLSNLLKNTYTKKALKIEIINRMQDL